MREDDKEEGSEPCFLHPSRVRTCSSSTRSSKSGGALIALSFCQFDPVSPSSSAYRQVGPALQRERCWHALLGMSPHLEPQCGTRKALDHKQDASSASDRHLWQTWVTVRSSQIFLMSNGPQTPSMVSKTVSSGEGGTKAKILRRISGGRVFTGLREFDALRTEAIMSGRSSHDASIWRINVE